MRAHDVCVIGAGEAGCAAALRAAELGLSVVLIDRVAVGGTSLHLGRGPLSVLLHTAHVAESARSADRLGLGIAFSAPDVGAMLDHRFDAIDLQQRALHAQVANAGIEFLQATALVGEDYVKIAAGGGDAYLTPRNVVVAVGSAPRRQLGATSCDGAIVVDPHQAAALRILPQHPIIVGGGPTGLGFAAFWGAMGAGVTVVEAENHLLPDEEPAVASRLALRLQRSGITFRTQTVATEIAITPGQAGVSLSDGTTATTDLVLLAVGREPIGDQVGLAALGLLDRRGNVKVDDHYRTSLPSIRAVGSCTERAGRAHAGIEEGEMVAKHLAGLNPPPVDLSTIPRVLRTTPDAAFVGLTTSETEQRFGEASHFDVAADRYPKVSGSLERGVVTIVTEPDERITGVHLLGPDAEQSVTSAALIVEANVTASEALRLRAAHQQLAPELRRALRMKAAHSADHAP